MHPVPLAETERNPSGGLSRGCGNQLQREASNGRPPTVRFSTRASVVLIPSRQEYFDAGIDLWFNREDQATAQAQVAEDVKGIMYDHPNLSFLNAMSYLYQPKSEDEFCSALRHQYSDSKERLNILLVHPVEDSFGELKQLFRRTLVPYNRWVISWKHALSCEDGVDIISESTDAVDSFDLILIHERIFLNEAEIEILSMMDAIHRNYRDKVVVGLIIKDRCPGVIVDLPKSSGRRRVDSFGVIFPFHCSPRQDTELDSDNDTEAETVCSDWQKAEENGLTNSTSTEVPSAIPQEAMCSVEELPEGVMPEAPFSPLAANDRPRSSTSAAESIPPRQLPAPPDSGPPRNFLASLVKDPVDTLLHEKAAHYGLDFLWREPLKDVVHILPYLLIEKKGRGRINSDGYLFSCSPPQNRQYARVNSPRKSQNPPPPHSVAVFPR